ncbi:MAG: IS1634 family transposase [Dermatophilus congolensis]|nr:IS1634 family transposase [Dermatophilus congolensis]
MIEHLGSAHTEAELAALVRVGQAKLRPGQDVLPLEGLDGDQGSTPVGGQAVILGSVSALLIDTVRRAWEQVGFTTIGDEAFFQLVLARLVEPTSVRDMPRVLGELGVDARHRNSLLAALKRAQAGGYRERIAAACFAHATTAGDLSLCLYDVTTLYFEAEKEDSLRKVGYSKERRVDPQIVVGLLVDRGGFPLQVGCFEGNPPQAGGAPTAETTTILPLVRAFQEAHQIADMVVVADAGMLSSSNLRALDAAGLRFIVGSRTTKAPADLASHFAWHGDAFTDGQIIDTITARTATTAAKAENNPDLRSEPIWDRAQHPRSW